jgi:hypothetical protein
VQGWEPATSFDADRADTRPWSPAETTSDFDLYMTTILCELGEELYDVVTARFLPNLSDDDFEQDEAVCPLQGKQWRSRLPSLLQLITARTDA